jgi:amino acid adenylation domain-containing protein
MNAYCLTDQNLLDEWNNTHVDYPLGQCFPQLFEAQVAASPDAIAVICDSQQLTYQQLNTRANVWARQLVELGVGAEMIVALVCDRNIEFLTAMLAVFKAGGAYLPLNPLHPEERTEQVLSQSQVPFVLTTSHWVSLLSPIAHRLNPSPELVILEKLDRSDYSSENLPVRCTPDNLAYVIYTSGSTGKPKGAMLEHRGMLNQLFAKVTDLQLSVTDVVAQTATQTFDISIWQFLVALLVGGSVEIIDAETAADPARLLSLVDRQGISILEIVPSLLRMILQEVELGSKPALSQLRWLLLTGETLPPRLCREWFESYPTIPMMNAYGPTECSDDVTHYPIYQAPGSDVVNLPIGRAVSNTQLYVLDPDLQPVPIGEVGELYVGGVGVGRGYLYNPMLTERAFIKHDLATSARLYKTGDRARYLSDGNIEFLGRIDYQVKIRGFRIELGEIEAILAQHPHVRQVAVIDREDQPGNHYLAAYLVPSQAVSARELRDFLSQKLPHYMVPSAFVCLDSLPLTPNGKIDRRGLPVPEMELSSPHYIAPQTPTQTLLAQLWAEVLNLKQVGIEDHFFDLGGHSLLATQVVSRVRSQLQIELSLRQLFENPTIAELSEIIDGIDQMVEKPAIVPIPRDSHLPLSSAQTRLWFLNQLETEKATYNMLEALQLQGCLNITALQQAFQEIVRRHEGLRTTFETVDNSPVQVIHPTSPVAIAVVDWQHLFEQEQAEQVQQLATAEAQQPFNLAFGSLLRVTLIKLAAQSHVLLLTMHHIISDGWSMGVLIDELSVLYSAFCGGKASPLPELTIQYADFAHWQQQWLRGEVLQSQLDYWKQQLAGAPPLLELPTDRPRPSVQTFAGSTKYFQLNAELTSQLKTLSRQSGVTLFMTLLAAFSTLLSRYSGQDDIVIGSPIANRNHREVESLIGFFVNTLTLRTQLTGNPCFSELLQQVRATTLAAYDHQDLPFEKLVEALHPERSLSHTPLFQVMFVLQNAASIQVELPELTVTPLQLEDVTARFDLTLSVTETDTELTGAFVYNSDLFDASTLDRLAEHFQTLLAGIVASPQQRVAQLPLLTAREQQQLLVEWNQTQTAYPQDKAIHQLFEAQVEQTPDAIAVVFEDQQLTYRELNDRANQLAHYLQKLGVQPDVLVGICVERSLEMIVGLLGILKAGGAYVPLDPAYPTDRINFMLSDAQVAVLLTQQHLQAELPKPGLPVICLDSDWSTIAQESTTNPNSNVQPHDLAYVIYTSGSTGKPKGVLVEHQGLCNLALAQIDIFDVHAESRVLQFASFSFDASISEVVMTLCIGARLCLAKRETLMPGPGLLRLLQEEGITHVTLSPSALAALPTTDLPNLRTIIVAGEACPPALAAQLSAGRRFVNGYGPTESTVCALAAVNPAAIATLPIGRPIANIQVYILDRQLQPVPVGVPGELHIGGAGLARGYLNRPELTQEKFIPNPFSTDYSGRLYKTGDLVRYRPDGNIEFLGRIDQQVKIRGFRVELEEIEALLSQHSEVREAVVVVREDQPGNKRLIAYIVSNRETLSTNELRQWLKDKLPEFMVPSAFALLETLPLTPNGKVNRKALAAIALPSAPLETTFVAPRTPVEATLAEIWAEILGLDQVGIEHNFFELGGHSLLATQVISRIQDTLQISLPLRSIFEQQTIAELATTIVQNMVEDIEDEEMERILAELEACA